MAAALLASPAWIRPAAAYAAAPKPESPEVKSLVVAALSAATDSGATYADVHFTVIHREHIWNASSPPIWVRSAPLDDYWRYVNTTPGQSIIVGIGVRALIGGYWGFAGFDGVPTKDAAVTLGKSAAAQAREISNGPRRVTELGPAPAHVANGSWTMPGIDPLSVPLTEKLDFLHMLMDEALRAQPTGGSGCAIRVARCEQTFASSDRAYTTQITYTTGADWDVAMQKNPEYPGAPGIMADSMTVAGAGWEYLCTQPIPERARELLDTSARLQFHTQSTPGRYDLVCDAYTTAALVDCTLGRATELDRAMGYLANSVGTSYLSDPVEMLGTEAIGAPAVTVTANRSMEKGAATVHWDDEGIVPSETALVTQGKVTDFQTTRESASWLAPAYTRVGKPVVSNGCAHAVGGTTPLTQRCPNLVLQPGAGTLSFEELVKNTKRGIAAIGVRPSTDFQALNGTGGGEEHQHLVEIVNGRLGQILENAQFVFRAPDLWRSVTALGGPTSARAFGFERSRDVGDPGAPRYVSDSSWLTSNRVAHTVSAVPMIVSNMAVMNVL